MSGAAEAAGWKGRVSSAPLLAFSTTAPAAKTLWLPLLRKGFGCCRQRVASCSPSRSVVAPQEAQQRACKCALICLFLTTGLLNYSAAESRTFPFKDPTLVRPAGCRISPCRDRWMMGEDTRAGRAHRRQRFYESRVFRLGEDSATRGRRRAESLSLNLKKW